MEAEAVSQTEEARAEISSEPETVAAETLETEQTAVSESEGGETGAAEPAITEGDWEEYFDGFNGAAVIYDASAMQYTIYNNKLAQTRRSPCSTFKISPKEQTEAMERIFGTDSVYSTDTRDALKQVMLVTEQKEADCLFLCVSGKNG